MTLAKPRVLANRNGLRRALVGALTVGAVALLATPRAQAHFILQTPAAWMSQDAFGAPEKMGPCGDEGGGTATGAITALTPGQTVTITIDEVVFHPGHYRIALAADRSQLPAEPVVTPNSASPCGSVPVESSPAFPVLADGVFEHTSAFTAPQTVQVTIPANLTCTKCTLQVIEFMSDHPLNNPGGCFYHHCADVSIGAAVDLDGGVADAGVAAAPSPPAPSSSGCSVSASARAAPSFVGVLGLLVLAGLVRRRAGSRSAI